MKRTLKILAVAFVLAVLAVSMLPSPALAVTRTLYWVGGTGNWSDIAHWSLSSGGAGGEAVPDSDDDVFFDANSDTGAAFTVVLNQNANVRDMDWSAVDVVPTLDWANTGSYVLLVYGSLTLVAGMDIIPSGGGNSASLGFTSTAAGETVTTAGVSIDVVVDFYGNGGVWTLQDTFTVTGDGAQVNALVVEGGATLNTNGQTVNASAPAGQYAVRFDGAGVAGIVNLGASVVNVSGGIFICVNNPTFNAGTSSIRLTGTAAFAGGAETYNDVQLNGTAHTVSGANTFATLTRTGTATTTDTVTFAADQTITGTLTFAGNSAANRLTVKSDAGARTLTAGVISTLHADYQNITAAGASSPWDATGGSSSANLGGNTNITFNNKSYWVGGIGSWSSASTRWSGVSGGSSHTNWLPTSTQDVFFDANSDTGGNFSVTNDSFTSASKSIDWSGVDVVPTFNNGSKYLYISGSLTLKSGMTFGGGGIIQFRGADSTGFTTSGVSIGAMEIQIAMTAPASLTLQDTLNFNSLGSVLSLVSGTLNTNGQTVYAYDFDTDASSSTRVLVLGASLIYVSDDWHSGNATGLTINAGTSSIILGGSGVFAGGGKTYNIVSLAGTNTVSGANTFATLNISAAAGTETITLQSNQVVTGVFTIDRSLGAKVITGNYTITVGTLSIPISGVTTVTITNTDFSQAAGTVTTDYLILSGSAASGGATFIAGTNSTDNGGNSGWIYREPTVTTQAASSVEATTATGNGNITATGGDANIVTSRGFDWDIDSGAPYANSATDAGAFGTGAFTKALAGLPTGTTIYYRAKAQNAVGWGYGVEMTFLTKPAAPTNVAATDGTSPTQVTITWTKPTGATGYRVYRDAGLIATLGDVATYGDTGADPPVITAGAASASDGTSADFVSLSVSGQSIANGTTHSYYVVAANATGDSANSAANNGYRGAAALTYQWQRSAADSDAAYSNIAGATAASYSDTGAPNNGSGRYYRATISSTGAVSQNTLADRGYRPEPGRGLMWIGITIVGIGMFVLVLRFTGNPLLALVGTIIGIIAVEVIRAVLSNM